MIPTPEALQIALAHHQAGRLREAETLYRQILAAEPAHAEALGLLGVLAHQAGQHAAAVECLARAISLRPDNAEFHYHLGAVYQVQQQLDRAIASYGEALRINPRLVPAHLNLGAALNAQGRTAEAVESLRAAVELEPKLAEAHFNLGFSLHALGDTEGAGASYREALRVRPDYVEAMINLGELLRGQDQLDDACAWFDRALTLDPRQALAHQGRGNIYLRRGMLSEAQGEFETALSLDPHDAKAYNNLATVLQELQQFDAALALYRQALERDPHSADVLVNIGSALQSQGQIAQANEHSRRALAIDPHNYRAHFNLGVAAYCERRDAEALAHFEACLCSKPGYAEALHQRATICLSHGDFASGWRDYESRLQCAKYPVRRGPPLGAAPRWDGSDLAGRTLLVHAEQGLGDTLQFIRYAKLAELRNYVVVEVQPALLPLLHASGFKRVFARGAELPHFDVYVPLLSMPGVMGTTLETIPNQVPYLAADPGLCERWRQRLQDTSTFKVGIAWQGRTSYAFDRYRSIPLAEFAPLADVSGVELVSVQKNAGAEQIAALRGRFTVTDLGSTLDREGAFMDTAAVLANLDLVITSDTAVAHLAGGMGLAVWVALSEPAEWRWLHERSDSPWYPTMRLFRQPQPGDWAGAFGRMKDELAKLVQARQTAPFGKT